MQAMQNDVTTDVRVLRGIRVLEVGQVLSAPFAGSVFADLGADVLKVERPEGDEGRNMGKPFRNGDAVNFHIFNRGKQSITLDLKSEAGKAEFERLAAQADIMLHNLRPGVAAEMGIDGESMCARHPRLIYCEISAFGHVGPMKLRPGYEPLVQAYSGLSSSNGGPTDPPVRIGASVCDMGSGLWCVVGALALLQQRASTGRGGVVQSSLLESALTWNVQRLDSVQNGLPLPPRHASGHPGYVPYEAFEAQDGPLLICCGNDRLFAKLANATEQPQWIVDPRFATNRARLEHRDEMVAQLSAVLQTQKRAVWITRFLDAGVPCSPIYGVTEMLEEEQVRALDMFAPVSGADYGLTGLPLSINGVRPRPTGRAPRLGEHNGAASWADIQDKP